MELLPLSFLAGVLTVLSPCVLPLLPVVLAGSVAEKNWRAPLVIIGSLAVSVIAFTLLIRSTALLLGVPTSTWLVVSGALVAFIGITFAFPWIWERLVIKLGLEAKTGKLMAKSAHKSGTPRNILLGLSLGPVFTSCSPTFGLILATVLPTSFGVGFANILTYTLSLSVVLLIVAFGGQRVTSRLGWATDSRGTFRRGLGVFLVIVGVLIMTGLMKDVETWMVERGWLGATKLEQRLLEGREEPADTSGIDIPNFLLRSFPDTDWSKADPAIANALDGGAT